MLALVAVLLTWGAWEVGCWFWPRRGWLNNPWYSIETQAAQRQSTILPFERPPHFYWMGRSHGDLAHVNGDLDPEARVVTFRTDHEGFRNATDMNHADLIFLGDSYTESGNLPEEETFPQQVGRALGLSVRNLGRAAYAPPYELVVLKVYGLPCRPRAVVWQIAEVNDLVESDKYRRWDEIGRPLMDDIDRTVPSRRAYWQRRSPLCRLYRLMRGPRPWPLTGTFREVGGREVAIRFEVFLPGPEQIPHDHPGWPPFAASLREGAALLKVKGIPLVVVLIPMKLRAMGHAVTFDAETRAVIGPGRWDLRPAETLAQRVGELCGQENVRFIDATPALRAAAAAGQTVYLPMDTHLSSAGHAVVAELIAAALRQEAKVSGAMPGAP